MLPSDAWQVVTAVEQPTLISDELDHPQRSIEIAESLRVQRWKISSIRLVLDADQLASEAASRDPVVEPTPALPCAGEGAGIEEAALRK
jgi:hypothetical protein